MSPPDKLTKNKRRRQKSGESKESNEKVKKPL
jgi:hypothetical protein